MEYRSTAIDEKKSERSKRGMALAIILAVVAALAWNHRETVGYLAQAATGQASLLLRARSIDRLIADPSTDPALRARLEKVREIRRFAVHALDLPDNGNFRTYVDVGAPFVIWNVVATPELSLQPLQWCYPIAGCVSYRGYYREADARAYADRLRAQGYAVQVDGVTAFSTLGWLPDPLLSTVLDYSDTHLARLIFHELAHSRLWVKDDTRFNEAFAVAVEEEGVRRWLEHTADPMRRANYELYSRRKRDFLSLLDSYQQKLAQNFSSSNSAHEKRREKAELMRALGRDFKRLRLAWGGFNGYDEWFRDTVDNAELVSFSTYHSLVPGFRELVSRSTSMGQFYKTAASLAELSPAQRQTQLLTLRPAAQSVKIDAPPAASRPVASPGPAEVRPVADRVVQTG